jgi:hypothetical protein
LGAFDYLIRSEDEATPVAVEPLAA